MKYGYRSNDMAAQAVSITPSNTDENHCYGLYVGTGGDVKVDMKGSGTVTFKNVPDGTFMPISVSKIYSTGTSASDIVGLK